MYDFETAASQRRYQTMLRIEAGKKVLDQLNGKTRQVRQDGYVNLLSKYGTSQDNSTAYFFSPESIISDQELTDLYTGGGVFAKIIDAPAEEAVKKGFDTGITDQGAREYVEDTFAWLEWDENIATAMKWARLYGGAIAVLMVDDGRGLEEPLDMDAIKSIDEIRVYDRSIATPDFTSVYRLDPLAGKAGAGGRRTFLSPQFYDVSSINGSFRVHESRCLIFRNGKIPERSQLAQYRGWGIPEYIRIKKELREATTSTSYSVKMLEKCVQAIYSMKNLAELLATDDGEEVVLKRLRVIDMARSALNSIAIDADGENYDFKSMTLSGVKDIVETSFCVLSAVSNIPQTILYGRSPAGENSTGLSDLENWYSYVGRNQRIMMRANMKYLLDIIIKAGMAQGYILEDPKPKLEFKPLWELSEEKQAIVNQAKATTAREKAQTAQIYMDYQVLSPSEVRAGLAKEGTLDIDTLLDDIPEDEEWGMGSDPDLTPPAGGNVQTPAGRTQEAGGTPQPGGDDDLPHQQKNGDTDDLRANTGKITGVGVLVLKDGMVLVGRRNNDFCTGTVCGPGGHIEEGESSREAAVREAREEFGITIDPEDLTLFGVGGDGDVPSEFGTGAYYLTTKFAGEPTADGVEMTDAQFADASELMQNEAGLFPPFADSLRRLLFVLQTES